MSGGVGRFWAAMQARGDASYQGARDYANLVVTGVDRDSAGAVLSATGTIDGTGAFTVPLRGTSASPGDHLLVSYPKGDPGGELAFERFVFSDDVSAGLLVVNPDLPAPGFIPPIYTTALDATTTAIDAYIVVYFRAVEAKYNPSGYTVSYRPVGGEWADQPVPHIGGAQQARLASNFPPGVFVDVKLRARYNWTGQESLPTAAITVQAAVDDVSPGFATSLAVDLTVAGGVTLRANGTVDPAHFKGWIYEVASGTNGPVVAQSGAMPADWFVSLPAGTYYAAAYPLSHSGVQGGRFPGTGFQGPFTVTTSTAAPDTTPPPDWSAPVLSSYRLQEKLMLRVTLPGYAYPADYSHTEARVATNGGAPAPLRIPSGAAYGEMQVDYGTSVALLVGYDQAGNFSLPGPTASLNVGSPGAPAAAPVLTATKFALAVKLTWTAVVAATGYEVERAPDVGGSAGTYARVATVDSLAWLDTLADQTIVLPTYWYRVRAINLQGNGPYSSQAQQSVDPVDGRNLRLNSVTAAQVAADTAIFNKILATQTILGPVIATDSAPSARVEIRGNVATNPNQIRFVDNVGGTELVRAVFQGNMFTFNSNSQASADALVLLDTGGGITLSNWLLDLSPGLLFARLDRGPLRLRVQAGGAQNYFAVQRLGDTTLGITPSTTGMVVDFRTATLYANNLLVDTGGLLHLHGSGTRYLQYNAGNGTYEFHDAALRQVNADGSALKLLHSGTAGNMHVDWSHGALYLGFFSNPASNVIVANGAGTYGPIAASAFNISSSERGKRDIRDLTGMRAALRALKPRRYALAGDAAHRRDRFGFVAEEVEPFAPNAVVTLPGMPLREPTSEEPTPPVGEPTKAIDLYGLVTVIAGGVLEEFAEIARERDALATQLAALSARVAALEGAAGA